MRFVFLLLFVALLQTLHAQENVLLLKDSMYYTESNTFSKDKTLNLCQEVSFNRPGSVDEEFTHTLHLVFLKSDSVKAGQIFQLASDTLLLKSTYGILSPWNWGNSSCTFNGQIEIVEWKKRSITVKEDILVYDTFSKETVSFTGTRTFKKKKQRRH